MVLGEVYSVIQRLLIATLTGKGIKKTSKANLDSTRFSIDPRYLRLIFALRSRLQPPAELLSLEALGEP